MGMSKEEVAMKGFEIVAYAGDARTRLLNALSKGEEGNFEEAEKLVEEANDFIKKAHNAQTDMLKKESSGDEMELGFIMVHGQDHLMTTMLLKDIIKHLLNMYQRTQ